MIYNFYIDSASRRIKAEPMPVMWMDHRVQTIHFSAVDPEGFTFDGASILIKVILPDKSKVEITPENIVIEEIVDTEDEEEIVTGHAVSFDWTLDQSITRYKGTVSYSICAVLLATGGTTVAQEWHTADGKFSVQDHIHFDGSDDQDDPDLQATNAEKIAALKNTVSSINTRVNGLSSGAPPTADSTAEMDPDDSSVYVNTTDGYLYFWDGEDWQIGGIYGANIVDDTVSEPGMAAEAAAVRAALNAKADASDLSAVQTTLEGKADSADLNVINNKIDAVIESESATDWETFDKESEMFTQIPGHIGSGGGISGTSSDIHKTWYFVADKDLDVYVTRTNHTGQLKLGVYTGDHIASGEISQYGSGATQGTLPTEDAPFHAETGQCVAVSIYNTATYDWVLHIGTETTVSMLKQTVGLTDQMETEVDTKVSSVQYEVDVHDLLINTFHGLINYGYDTEESRDPVPSATDSTVFGYHRKKYVITVSGGLDAKDTVIKLNGNIETTISTSTVRSWTASVPLEDDRLYRFTAQMISGELSSVESDDYDVGVSVYKSGASTSRGSYTVSADRKKFVREVIGEGVLYNICLYIDSGVTLTNAKYLVIMEDITGEQEESGGSIETYFLPEMEDTVSKVRDSADAPALVFPLVTDIHRYSSASQTFDKMIANMRKFTKEVKCDFIVNMGDTIDGNAQQETSLEYAYDSSADFCNIGIPYFFANGNHDNNPYISSATLKFNIQQTFKAFYAGVKGVTYNIAENGTDYFIDFENLEVRIISLNSCNVNVSATYAYGSSTASWLASALDTTHAVIVVTHVSPIPAQVWNNNSPTNNTSIKNALQDFVDGGGKLILFAGHSHVDATFIDPWVSIMQVCQKFEQADITTEAYGKMSGYIDVLGNPARTSETYTEDAWSVCVYKPFDDVLDIIRFGAGADRHIHLTPIGAGTVTSQLDNVTWSSSDTSVATVSGGVITGVGAGRCAILAKDSNGNYECWIVEVS